MHKTLRILGFLVLSFFLSHVEAQTGDEIQWTPDGDSYYSISDKGITIVDPRHPDEGEMLLSEQDLVPEDSTEALDVQSFDVSDDGDKLLLFTNTKRVWRLKTRGDYWVYDKNDKELTQMGKELPGASLMFAKFSPDAKKVAYVSEHNIYVENQETGEVKRITDDGTDRIINGTFDWVYEEEFGARDGFRWSPDGEKIAYWKLDARDIRNYLMLNTTDSLYSYTIPVEYPKVGEDPSKTNLWFYDLDDGSTTKAEVPGDEIQHYIPRMEWLKNSKKIILQQLNRKQNESKIITAKAKNGKAKTIHSEKSDTWIDIKTRWAGTPKGWDWIDKGKAFIWLSEKDGWRHIYKMDLKGNKTLLTKGDFDVIKLNSVDEDHDRIYFTASPDNATREFLYQISLEGGEASRVTPGEFKGTNDYDISPGGELAVFNSSSTEKLSRGSVVELPSHKELTGAKVQKEADSARPKTEFFQVTTKDDVTMDGWVVKPDNFDPDKKYPIVFFVYGEPASQTVTDQFGQGQNRLYDGDMAEDGYIYVSLDNRGSPAPKGTEWRHSIYRKIGRLNIRDQAMGAKKLLDQWNYVDTSRVAVWGWSGGGASTLDLLGQYPEIFKTGIAVAPVTNQLLYDNIYQERYMGLPQENKEDFVKGSAVNYAKNVKGNLLIIHGTGDDNVHFQNTQRYINELIKYGIPFQMMAYPNRTHALREGEGTTEHLKTTYTNFLRNNCPPGAE